MAKLIRMEVGGTPVLIAVATGDDDIVPVGKLEDAVDSVHASLSDSFRVISQIADEFVTALQGTVSKIASAELEFGLEATGKGNIFVVETTAKANFKVKLCL